MAAKSKETVGTDIAIQGKAIQKYSIEKLQMNCHQLFGISTSTFAGATYGMTGEYSVEEMKAHIEAGKKKKGVQ